MNPYFAITPEVWNGTSERLGRKRSYHATISVPDEPEREMKAGNQDYAVLVALTRLGTATASQVHKDISVVDTILLSSVRRSLNTLFRKGRIRKVGSVPGPFKHPEVEWMAC